MRYQFRELVDIPALQSLTDELYEATAIPSAIITRQGEVLTGSGWQRICTEFHRKHPAIQKECIESDTRIRERLGGGEPFVVYRCPRGLLDASCPVIIEGEHVANVFVGQLFTEAPDGDVEATFRGQARRFGFDEHAYMEAFREVPILPEGRLRAMFGFLSRFAEFVAKIGLASLREREARDEIKAGERKYQRLLESTNTVPWELDLATQRFTYFGPQAERLLGYPAPHWSDREAWLSAVHPEDRESVCRHREAETRLGRDHELTYRMVRPDQRVVWIQDVVNVVSGPSGPERLAGFMHDVTERKRAEEELQRSEERLQAAVNAGRMGVWDWDIQANLLTWDDRMYELYGVTREDFPRGVEAWEQGVHPDDRARALAASRAAVRGEASYDTEFRIVRPDRSVTNVKANGVVTRDADGNALRMIGLNWDVTEARQAEERYLQLFREMIDGFALHEMLFDPAGEPVDYRFLAVNPAFERLTGLEVADVVGKTVRDVIPGIDPGWVEMYGRVALTGEPVRFEHEARGLGRHYDVKAYRPAPGQFATVFADVTERKLAEEGLRQEVGRRQEAEARARNAAELFRLLFEEAGDNIVLLRPQPEGLPVIVDVNRQGLRLYGFEDKADVVGREVVVFYTPESAALAAERVAQIVEAGELRFEVRHRTQDGRVVPLEVRARRVDVGGVPHVLAVERDISSRLELEERLRQAQKMEAIGTLAGGIAHDFNNILTPIMAHGELALMQLPEGAPARDDISSLLCATERAAALVRHILAVSRKEVAGTPVPVSVGALVEETANFLRASIPKTIDLRVEVDPSCGPVLAEPTRLHQMILNLCTNAIYATAEKGGVLTMSLEREGISGATGWLRLVVSDTGSGIPAEVQERIFEPYFTTKPVGKGSGLGLAVVHGIVTNLGGEIRVRSVPGEGARFEVLLPEAEGSAPPRPSPAIGAPGGA